MNLTIDIGNTSIVVGIFDSYHLAFKFRLKTDKTIKQDALSCFFDDFFVQNNIEKDSIKKILISSVVPELDNFFEDFFSNWQAKTHFISYENLKKIIKINYKTPKTIGVDRVVNIIGARLKYKKDNLIVIDFGTATTFDLMINKEYMGGAIAPGFMISSSALFEKTSKLFLLKEFLPPESVIGKNTKESVASGLVFGYCHMINGMIAQIKDEINLKDITTIATGGLAVSITKYLKSIDIVDENLSIESLNLLAKFLHNN